MTSRVGRVGGPTAKLPKVMLTVQPMCKSPRHKLLPAGVRKPGQALHRAPVLHRAAKPKPAQRLCASTSQTSVSSRRPSVCALSSMLRRVHFDFNGNGVDVRTRGELSALMQLLLQKRQNCCLLRFSNQRRCSMLLLYNLLVRQVGKYLTLMHGKLVKINLTYFYLRRHDTCNAFRKVLRSKLSFSTTLHLFKWLDHEYSTLFGNGQRHECFNIEFEYMTLEQVPTIYKVNLVILQLYLHRMDAETKRSLCTMLRQPAIVKDANEATNPSENYFLLKEFLHQYLSGGSQWATWIFFDVSSSSGDINADLLKLAKASYVGLKVEKQMLFKKLKGGGKRKMRIAGGGVKKELFFIKPPPLHKKTMEKYGDWILRIDEKFSTVLRTLKEYYQCKYEQKIGRVSNFMRQIAHPKQRVSEELGSDITISADLTWYQNRYKLAQSDLERFLREIERSNVKHELLPYLRLKLEQLERSASEHKVQQLKACKQRLVDVINSEIEMLQSPSERIANDERCDDEMSNRSSEMKAKF